jgi:hypothetical protein
MADTLSILSVGMYYVEQLFKTSKVLYATDYKGIYNRVIQIARHSDIKMINHENIGQFNQLYCINFLIDELIQSTIDPNEMKKLLYKFLTRCKSTGDHGSALSTEFYKKNTS